LAGAPVLLNMTKDNFFRMAAIPYKKLILHLFFFNGTPSKIMQQKCKLDSVLRDRHISERHMSPNFIFYHKQNMPVNPQLSLIIRRCLPSPFTWPLASWVRQAQSKHIAA
jgi:hypothetical protein